QPDVALAVLGVADLLERCVGHAHVETHPRVLADVLERERRRGFAHGGSVRGCGAGAGMVHVGNWPLREGCQGARSGPAPGERADLRGASRTASSLNGPCHEPVTERGASPPLMRLRTRSNGLATPGDGAS